MKRTILTLLIALSLSHAHAMQQIKPEIKRGQLYKSGCCCLYRDRNGAPVANSFQASFTENDEIVNAISVCYLKSKDKFLLGFDNGLIKLVTGDCKYSRNFLDFKSDKTNRAIRHLAISPDGKTIIAIISFATAAVIDISNLDKPTHIKLTPLPNNKIIRIIWSPDSSYWCAIYKNGASYFYTMTEKSSLKYPAFRKVSLDDYDEFQLHDYLTYTSSFVPVTVRHNEKKPSCKKHMLHLVQEIQPASKPKKAIYWEIKKPKSDQSSQAYLEQKQCPLIFNRTEFLDGTLVTLRCPEDVNVVTAEHIDNLVVFTLTDGTILQTTIK